MKDPIKSKSMFCWDFLKESRTKFNPNWIRRKKKGDRWLVREEDFSNFSTFGFEMFGFPCCNFLQIVFNLEDYLFWLNVQNQVQRWMELLNKITPDIELLWTRDSRCRGSTCSFTHLQLMIWRWLLLNEMTMVWSDLQVQMLRKESYDPERKICQGPRLETCHPTSSSSFSTLSPNLTPAQSFNFLLLFWENSLFFCHNASESDLFEKWGLRS